MWDSILQARELSGKQLTIKEINPDVVIYCTSWTAVNIVEGNDKVDVVSRYIKEVKL